MPFFASWGCQSTLTGVGQLETSVAILLDRQKRLGRQGYDAYLQDLYSRLVSLHSSDPRKFSDSYILCALRLAADVHHVEDRLKKHGDFVIYLDAPGKVASSLVRFGSLPPRPPPPAPPLPCRQIHQTP